MANQLVEMISRQAARYGAREAYRFCWKKNGEWLQTSWADFALQIDVAARALCAIGLKEGEKIAICSPNTPQILISEFAAFKNRSAAIPIYASSSQEQLDFILNDGEAKVLFIGDSYQYPLAYRYYKSHPKVLKKIVVYKNSGIKTEDDDDITISWDDFVRLGQNSTEKVKQEVSKRTDNALPSDLATLIYTSGTTGTPKGVELVHSNYDAAMEMHLKLLKMVSDTDLSMAFLPMSHILEKAWCFFCLTKGIAIAINYDPRTIQDTIHQVHPNIMCCVPRFWEKVYTSVNDKLSSMSWPMRMAVKMALRTGRRRNLDYVRLGKTVPPLLEKQYAFWDKRLFAKLKNAIGIPDPNIFPTAGAPISDKICEFMRSVGINVMVGYGLSETTATVTCYPLVGYEIGTVGTPLPGLDVKISPEGEILVKGPTITPGYYHNKEANAEAFTPDGYFCSGDAGFFDKNGALVLTERIKDLFKTANGKYIAPQALESRLAENKYIDEVAVIGEGRKFVSALVVPNFHNLRKWAREHGIEVETDEALVNESKVKSFMLKQVEGVQSSLASYEQIKKIALLPNHFSIMNGEVTNTMKVRRPVVAQRYAKEIEEMYKE